MNIKEASHLLAAYVERDTPAFLWSPPGIGKSSIVHQLAAEKQWGIVDFRAVLRDPVDLRGLPAISGDTAKWLSPDDLPQADRDGPEGIFFMDELNAAPPSMQAACFGLVLDRKVGNYTLPPGWRVVAAGNRQSDRAAAQRMPSALANRFAHIDIEPDVEAFTEYAYRESLPGEVIAFLRFRPNQIHDMKVADERRFPSPRGWEEAAKYVGAGAVRLHAMSGIVGEGAAAEFEGFLRTYHSLPSIDQVIMDPDGARLPDMGEVAARYAIVSALAMRAKPNNFGNIMRYMERLQNREFGTMMVVDACRRDAALTHTEAFVKWAKDNQDVTL